MKSYPSIPGWTRFPLGTKCIAFDKLDGSNIRCEWSKKKGWHKFGSRTQLIDESNEVLGQSIEIFFSKYAQPLAEICIAEYQSKERIVAFLEFVGPNSFAGYHDPNDRMDLVLIDVDLYKKGFVPPRQFIKLFSPLGIPRIIHDGNFNREFVRDVQTNLYGLSEGVVVKATEKTKIPMTKVKTLEWISRVKAKYDQDEPDQIEET